MLLSRPFTKARATPARAALLALLAITATGAPATPAAAQNPLDPFAAPRAAAPSQASNRADRDGDGIYESLEQRMAGLPDDAPMRVIVSLSEDATSAEIAQIEREVGDFKVKN